MKRTLLALSLLTALGAAFAADPPITKSGDILVSESGMTLYVFDKDAAGNSACNGPCAALWPPVAAAGGAKAVAPYSILTRDDGAMQWAYKGKPLYTWAKDQKAGDRTGDGVNGVWHLAKH